MLRPLWFCAGMLSLALGMLGAALPLLPTTPFVLLAAYCFAHSSEKWHQWLLAHRSFGPLIRHWRDHRAISRRTKVYSVLAMGAVLLLSYLLDASNLVLSVQAAVLSGSALFILTRPEPPAAAALETDDE
ncbi:MAG: YbaN family protein [Pseudomonadota bacterium]